MENKNKEATVYLYDEIGYFGIDPGQFAKDFDAIKEKTIHLRINSPGGNVFDGIAIYEAVRRHPSNVVAHIDGLAGSMASVIALAANDVVISKMGYYMIHEPWSIAMGNADDMRKEADLLDSISDTLLGAYTDKTGLKKDKIKELMAEESWLNSELALEYGFVDRIDDNENDEALEIAARFDLSVFSNVPDKLKQKNKKTPTERELEEILRDAGLSRTQAKSVLAGGYKAKDDQRDAAEPTQRDVEEPKKVEKAEIKDITYAILARAERIAPARKEL